ncbi:MAG TPA: NB-ARC domain-containing protein [Longimicrobium sp.]|nr:NB-ARC domain-containing protein [Longimicrobium sp.]
MRKVKVLFFAADPLSIPRDGASRLLLDEDVRQIRQKVRTAEHRDVLEFDLRLATRTDDLLQALNETHPQVVHFSGHGRTDGLMLVSADGRRPHVVSAAALEQLFEVFRGDIRVVVLNACFSLPQAEAIASVVGCAIGTRGPISDEGAITFGGAFYRAIAFGESVQAAYDQARTALVLEHFNDRECPQLVVRPDVDPAGLILIPSDDADERARGLGGAQVGTIRVSPGRVPDLLTVSVPAARHGVPACKSPNAVRLFGRSAEIDLFVGLLTGADDPVWAVRGLPGAGKTDFVRAVGCAPGTVEHFRGGVLYAELGQTAGAGEVLRRWCVALDLEPPRSEDPDDFTEIIRRHLAGHPALLVLDDVWDTTISAAQTLADCRAPGCALLLSTRSPDVADALSGSPDRAFRLPMLEDAPARALLREHAPDAVKADPDGATDLVASLGNLPLALKLAGYLVQRDDSPYSCRHLLGTWRVRLDEMKGRERRPGMAAGELSLDAIISLSYDAMADAETRAAAASLSVLGAAPLDFDRAAIEVAWDVDPARAAGWISSFVASGLLERNPSTRRYSLHQTVHAFLEERCRAWMM